jgi:hypothetical protein
MPAERVYVGVQLNGQEQFYQRETERKGKDGRWEAVPHFVLKPEATTMSEAAARIFVARLRSLGVNPWIQDAKDGRRIETSTESPQPQFGDTRTAVKATLDDDQMIASNEARWYVVYPINRPDGAGQWFIKCTPPGFPNAQVIYGKDPISCLQPAADIDILRFAELAPPQEQPKQAPQNTSVVRRRPGDRYND